MPWISYQQKRGLKKRIGIWQAERRWRRLVCFQDANSDPDPVINFQVSWKEIQSFFQKEIPQIARRLVIQEG